MYADGFGVKTQTFITQDVTYLTKKNELTFVCIEQNNTVNIPHVNVQKIDYKTTIFKKIQSKFIPYTNFKNKHFKTTINSIINKIKPDVIHCQFGIEALRLIDNLDQNTSIPLVIQFRGYDASRLLNHPAYVKRLQEVLSKPHNYAIFVSESLRKNLNKYHINTQNSMILHSGIDVNKFVPNPSIAKSDIFTFLQISSLKSKKGHTYTIKAFAQFLKKQSSKKYKLQLTGDGDEKKALKKLVTSLGIDNFVEFVGFVDHQKAKELLEKAHVFVHHSITPKDGDEEGIPNALMEAMAMELPVISTYHAGIPELITNEINGYLVKEKDINSYAQRMEDILSWGRTPKNRVRIKEKFEINYHIEKLESFYRSISLPKY
ncbi:MAG: Unknown protein [uncultured Sulfurovum sp.]|uniref:Glycosyl transferase family 1 domain-containing protein n=1 Tax=uncultured Sulfurovum sp. TaxID=269237 RepID=A0A6S6T1S8_9BACT|nr:MAG: Unknown protein [uncultured Sulfurovum sp.]